MATVKTLWVQGRAFGDQAASDPADFVRKGEFDAGLSGTAARVHRHDASDIDNLSDLFFGELQDELLIDDQSTFWVFVSGTIASRVRRKTGGGLLVGSEGLYIDSGTVSRPGHQHVAADVIDFNDAVYTRLQSILGDTNSIEFDFVGGAVTAAVRRKAAGGILEDADGIYIDFGSGTGSAARWDHTHSQLHNAVTFVDSDSLEIVLNGQEIEIEVRLASASGLEITDDGLQVDFGSGTEQVARGNHSHALLHNPVTTVNTNTVILGIDANQIASGTVRLNRTPGAGKAPLADDGNGIYLPLGTAAGTAAEGNHTHSVATSSTDGFLSAQDKSRLDALAGGAANQKEQLLIVLDGYGAVIPAGLMQYVTMPYSGTITGWDFTAHQSGTLVVDIFKDTWDNFPPTSADDFAGTSRPYISSGTRNRNLTIALNFNPNDVLAFWVASGVQIKKAELGLRIDRV